MSNLGELKIWNVYARFGLDDEVNAIHPYEPTNPFILVPQPGSMSHRPNPAVYMSGEPTRPLTDEEQRLRTEYIKAKLGELKR